MKISTELRSEPTAIGWRTLEWWGAGICLFLQTGAIFPLLLSDSQGAVSDAAQAKLRALSLPVYLISAGLLARHWTQLGLAVRRNLPVVMLLLLPLMSVAWSLSPSLTVRKVVALLGSALLSYLLAIRFTPQQLLLLFAFVLGPLMVLSIAMFAAHPGGEQNGVFIDKNGLGWMGAYAAVVGWAIARDRGLSLRPHGLTLSAMGLVCVAASGSATAIMSIFAAGVFAGGHALLMRTHGVGRVLLLLVLLQLALGFLSSLHYVILPLLEALGKDATLTGRVPLWAEVDKSIALRPLLGYGYQTFWEPANPEYWRIISAVGWGPPHSHNGYRDTILSLGFVGAFVLAAAIAKGASEGAKLEFRQPTAGWFWLNVIFGMYLTMNLTESLILRQNEFFWTTFVACLLMFSLRSRGASTSAAPG
jgi:exopolysaccharide production protein ExoQ